MKIVTLIISALIALLFGGCGNDSGTGIVPPASTAGGLDLVKTVTLTTDTDGGSARPEVIAKDIAQNLEAALEQFRSIYE